MIEKNLPIHVEFPSNPILWQTIDRVAEFVATDGYSAERYLLDTQATNNHYAFLYV